MGESIWNDKDLLEIIEIIEIARGPAIYFFFFFFLQLRCLYQGWSQYQVHTFFLSLILIIQIDILLKKKDRKLSSFDAEYKYSRRPGLEPSVSSKKKILYI